MKFNRFMVMVGALVVTYKTGELIGKIKGLKQIVDTYGEYIPHEQVTIKIGKDSSFSFANRGKKSEQN